MKLQTKVLIAVAVGVAGYLIVRKGAGAAAEAANAALWKVNPINNDNIINQGFTNVYQAVTGSTDTLGGDLYDVTHPPAAAGTNPINGAAISVYQKVTGSEGTIGTDLYDWLHPAPGKETSFGDSIRNFFLGDKDQTVFFKFTSPEKTYH